MKKILPKWPKPKFGKIRTLRECDLMGGVGPVPVYPVTSTKAVFNTKNENLEDILQNGIKFQEDLWVKNLYVQKVAPYIEDGNIAEGLSNIVFDTAGNINMNMLNGGQVILSNEDHSYTMTISPNEIRIANPDYEDIVITDGTCKLPYLSLTELEDITVTKHMSLAGFGARNELGSVWLEEGLAFTEYGNLKLNTGKGLTFDNKALTLNLGEGLDFNADGQLICTVEAGSGESTTPECTCEITSEYTAENGEALFKFNDNTVYGPLLGNILNISPLGNTGTPIATVTYRNGNSSNLYVDNSVFGDYVSLYGQSRITAAENDGATTPPEIIFENNTSYSSVGAENSYLENLTIAKTFNIGEFSNWYYNLANNAQENEGSGSYALMAIALNANSPDSAPEAKPVRLIKDSDLLSYSPEYTSGTLIGTLKILNNSINIYAPESSGGSIMVAEDDSEEDIPILFNKESDDVSCLSCINTVTINAYNSSIKARSFYQTSDIRLKENIEDINIPLETLLSIPTVGFNFIDDDKHHVGTIAQEVEKVCPEIVNTDKEGYKSVDYAKLSILALKGLKDMNERMNRLEGLINEII